MPKFVFPHYFTHSLRRELVELYASASIADFALSMVLLFEPVFFVTVLGWSITKTLLFFAAVYGLYIVLIPVGAATTAKHGYEHSMLFSIPFQISYWACLFFLPMYPALIFLAPLLYALQKSFFWPAFHSDMARYTERDQRAREFSGFSALIHIVYIAGPFLGGLISENLGIRLLLVIASVVYFTMFIPMFSTPEVFKYKPYHFRITLSYFKKFPREFLAYFGYGEELYLLAIWPVFIFLTVGSFLYFGAVLATTMLISTVILLYIGRRVDFEGKRMPFMIGASSIALIWLARIFASSVLLVVVVDVLSRIARDVFSVSMVSNFYDRANDEHVLPYVVFFEQSLSFGKLAAALIGAALFALTQSFIPLFVAGALFSLLFFFLPLKRYVKLG